MPTRDPEKLKAKTARYLAKNREKINARKREKYRAQRAQRTPEQKQRAAETQRRYHANRKALGLPARLKPQVRNAERARASSAKWREKMRALKVVDPALWYQKMYGWLKGKGRAHPYHSAWRLNNPEKWQALMAKRRARLLGAPGRYSGADLRRQLETQGGVCLYCGVDISTRYSVDHFVPLSKGGSNAPENIRLCCRSCNSRKGAKMPWEFMPRVFQPAG